MKYAACGRCRVAGRPPFSWLNRRGVSRVDSGSDQLPPADAGRSLCRACHEWLCGMTLQPGSEGRAQRPIGAPSGGAPPANGGWCCRLCGTGLPARAVRLDCDFPQGEAAGWVPTLLCRHCDLWLSSLLRDGRTAPSSGLRAIDGGYGSFPHRQLTGVSVQLIVVNAGARSAVASVCHQLGVIVVLREGSLSIRELGVAEPDGIRTGQPEILLVAPQQTHSLAEALSASAAETVDWLTIPVTPQQVSSALTRAARPHALVRWDSESSLPLLDLSANSRPVLLIERRPRVPAVEVAWLLKRFARGYDQVGVASGEIVFLPRVELRNLGIVATRLQAALRDVCLVHRAEEATRQPRLDVSG